MTHVLVEACGPATTLQDAGRFGWQRYGLGPAGAMDRLAQAEANALVGNALGAGVVELAIAGMRFRVDGGSARIALAGAEHRVTVDGTTVPPAAAVTIEPGQIVDISGARSGRFGYLAVAGGFDLPLVLGSLAFHSRALVGGLGGRALRPGDALPLKLANAPAGPDLMSPTGFVARADGPLRVLAGPQDDYFGEAGWRTFLNEPYIITANADRMGLRLTGPAIAHNDHGYNIVSDGIVTGSIQVPGSGEPLVLLADRQTTGGYPKIATIITADLPRIAQCGPGQALRFRRVTRAEGVTALREQVMALDRYKAALRPRGAFDLNSRTLLGLQLVDGWISAHE